MSFAFRTAPDGFRHGASRLCRRASPGDQAPVWRRIGLPLALLRSRRRHGASAVAEVCRPKELPGLRIIANCVHETKMQDRSKLYLFDTEALRKRLHHFGRKGVMNAECVLS